jgi:hypothetical protein
MSIPAPVEGRAMALTKPYAGVFPVAPTPFAENGDLDLVVSI